MFLVEIKALENGAHRNQNGGTTKVPDGWAVIPKGMEVPDTFPFVDIEVEDGIVVSMTAREKPEPTEPREPEPTAQDDTDSMLVDHEFRITMFELGV